MVPITSKHRKENVFRKLNFNKAKNNKSKHLDEIRMLQNFDNFKASFEEFKVNDFVRKYFDVVHPQY